MSDAVLAEFGPIVERLTESPHTIAVVATGAGLSFPATLWRFPGCSKNLIAADLIYSEEEIRRYTGGIVAPSTSPETARAMARECLERHPEASMALAITAAVTTATRVRRGDNKGSLCLEIRRDAISSNSDGEAIEHSGGECRLTPDNLPKSTSRDVCEAIVLRAAFSLLDKALG